MALQRLTEKDIVRILNKSGLGSKVQASQALEAFRLFVQSELQDVSEDDVKPLFVRHNILVIQTQIPAIAQVLKEREVEIVTFINAATKVRVTSLRFRA